MKVFLGGTCNGSRWRERLIPHLKCQFFDPVVLDWNEQAQEAERLARAECDVCLYVITPKATGVYSIAEAVDDSNKRPNKTMLCVLPEDDDLIWSVHQEKSLHQVMQMVKANGGMVATTLRDVGLMLSACSMGHKLLEPPFTIKAATVIPDVPHLLQEKQP